MNQKKPNPSLFLIYDVAPKAILEVLGEDYSQDQITLLLRAQKGHKRIGLITGKGVWETLGIQKSGSGGNLEESTKGLIGRWIEATYESYFVEKSEILIIKNFSKINPTSKPDCLVTCCFDLESSIVDPTRIYVIAGIIMRGDKIVEEFYLKEGDFCLGGEFFKKCTQEGVELIWGFNSNSFDLNLMSKVLDPPKLGITKKKIIFEEGRPKHPEFIFHDLFLECKRLHSRQRNLRYLVKKFTESEKLDLNSKLIDSHWISDRDGVVKYCLEDVKVTVQLGERKGFLNDLDSLSQKFNIPLGRVINRYPSEINKELLQQHPLSEKINLTSQRKAFKKSTFYHERGVEDIEVFSEGKGFYKAKPINLAGKFLNFLEKNQGETFLTDYLNLIFNNCCEELFGLLFLECLRYREPIFKALNRLWKEFILLEEHSTIARIGTRFFVNSTEGTLLTNKSENKLFFSSKNEEIWGGLTSRATKVPSLDEKVGHLIFRIGEIGSIEELRAEVKSIFDEFNCWKDLEKFKIPKYEKGKEGYLEEFTYVKSKEGFIRTEASRKIFLLDTPFYNLLLEKSLSFLNAFL